MVGVWLSWPHPLEDGDLDGALVDFNQFIKIRRTDAQTYDNRGEVAWTKQYQAAEADFRRLSL
jgi:hypothetical protein